MQTATITPIETRQIIRRDVPLAAKKQSYMSGFAHRVRGMEWIGHEQADCQSYTNGWNAGTAWLIDNGEV